MMGTGIIAIVAQMDNNIKKGDLVRWSIKFTRDKYDYLKREKMRVVSTNSGTVQYHIQLRVLNGPQRGAMKFGRRNELIKID
jgi:hypothetical protein